MVIPIGDRPNPRGVPIGTILLIAINVAVYVLVTFPLEGARPSPRDPLLAEYVRVMSRALGGQVSATALARQATAYDLYVFVHGFKPGAPSAAAGLVSMFLHAGFLHLAGNMLFLWIYGDNVEYRLGSLPFLVAYLGTGAVALIVQAVGTPGSLVPVVGASGAISGVLGFYFVWFPRNVVRLLWLFPPFIGRVFEVPARVVLGFFLLIENVLPYLIDQNAVGVAHGAHIGGFVAGVVFAWAIGRGDDAAEPEYLAPWQA